MAAPAPSTPPADALLARISDRSARIGVIGLGYVGLPLARVFHDAGFPVLGFDIDPAKIDALSRGRSYLRHLGDDFVSAMSGPRFAATTDFARLGKCDAVLICVPTPLAGDDPPPPGQSRTPDLSFVERTSDDIARALRPGQLVVLESTSYPGTTREVVLPRLQAGAPALACGRDYFVAFSPEREDPGRKDHTTATIPKVVGGLDPLSGDVAAALYRAAFKTVVPVSSAEVAEAAKILENTYRAVNIALVNELKVLFAAMGIDIWEVIEAARTKPFGFQAFYPGPGLGGHCIPIDPFYLAFKARQIGLPTRFIELAGEINHAMPDYVVSRLVAALDARGRTIRGARILILGMAYKPDIDDVRESPSFEIIEKLRSLGAIVDYHDPHVPATHPMRRHDLRMSSIPLTPETLAACDAAVVATAHAAIDWSMVARHAPLIIDTRGVLRDHPSPNIISA